MGGLRIDVSEHVLAEVKGFSMVGKRWFYRKVLNFKAKEEFLTVERTFNPGDDEQHWRPCLDIGIRSWFS